MAIERSRLSRIAGQGRTGVEMETAAFERALERFIQVTPDNVAKVVRTLAFKLEGKIKKRTPVDTGRLRSSFHTVAPGERDAFSYTAKDKQGNVQTYDGRLSENPAQVITGVIEAFVGTNVIYASSIEGGWSKKRPEGMVRVSVAELRGEVEQAIVRVLKA